MLVRLVICAASILGVATPALSQCVTGVEGGNVLTHWSNATQSFSSGATDQWPQAPSPDGASPMYTYGPTFLPDHDDYLTDNYARMAFTHAQAQQRMALFSNDVLQAFSANVPFMMYNPTIGNVLTRLVSNPGCVQIIHGLVVDNSFATVILPPNWTAAAPPGTYPIVVNPFYDVNDNVFGGFGSARDIALWVAESGLAGQTGAIGVIWNGGASLSSVTANDYARHQFASVIDLVATFAGGDRYRVLVGGGSRGALATLMLASNPEGYNYRVTYAIATGPATKLGTHVNLISATMPSQLGGLGASGFGNAWRPGWTYPAFGRPALVGMTAQQAALRLFSGNPDASWVDAFKSPISDAFVAGLLNAGTQVILSLGSHDPYIPFGTQAEYLFKLRAAGVPVEAHVLVRGGHHVLPGFWTKLRWAMASYFRPGADPALRMAETGLGSIRYYAVNRATNNADLFAFSNIQFPFTLEVPRFVYVGMPIVAMVTGEPGTEFFLHTNQGAPTFGVIGASRLWTLTIPASGAGTLAYTAVQIKKPGMPSFVNLDPTAIPGSSGMPLNTQIFAGPVPNVRHSTMEAWIQFPCLHGVPLACMPRVPGWSDVNWGMSEY